MSSQPSASSTLNSMPALKKGNSRTKSYPSSGTRCNDGTLMKKGWPSALSMLEGRRSQDGSKYSRHILTTCMNASRGSFAKENGEKRWKRKQRTKITRIAVMTVCAARTSFSCYGHSSVIPPPSPYLLMNTNNDHLEEGTEENSLYYKEKCPKLNINTICELHVSGLRLETGSGHVKLEEGPDRAHFF